MIKNKCNWKGDICKYPNGAVVRLWKTREENHIIKNYGRRRIQDIADEIGRSYPSVMGRVKKLKMEGRIVW
jgi:quinolinate synthase